MGNALEDARQESCSSRKVSLDKVKPVRLTYGVSTAGNQVTRGGYHRFDIVRRLVGHVLGHVPSEPIYRPRHREGEKRPRQKNKLRKSLMRLPYRPCLS